MWKYPQNHKKKWKKGSHAPPPPEEENQTSFNNACGYSGSKPKNIQPPIVRYNTTLNTIQATD